MDKTTGFIRIYLPKSLLVKHQNIANTFQADNWTVQHKANGDTVKTIADMTGKLVQSLIILVIQLQQFAQKKTKQGDLFCHIFFNWKSLIL